MEVSKAGDRRLVFTLQDITLMLFGFWPVWQNIWVNLRISLLFMGDTAPLLVITGICFLLILTNPVLKLDICLLPWVILIVNIILTMLTQKAYRPVARHDVAHFICGILFLACMDKDVVKKNMLVRITFVVGFFISATVLLDRAFGLFTVRLIGLYTDGARSFMDGRLGGGIIPATGAAALFVVSGLAAFLTQSRDGKSGIYAFRYSVTASFIISLVALNKRSQILVPLAAVAVIWGLHFLWTERKETISVSFFLKILLAAVLIAVMAVFLYNKMPMFRTSVDSFLEKIQNDDGTLSGRTQLFDLALRLFRQHPLTGVGWYRYRFYTVGVYNRFDPHTFLAHNCYLQVLSEMGLIGFGFFILALLCPLFTSFRRYHLLLTGNGSKTDQVFCELGIFFQLYFILYCMSGNPLYDGSFVILYFIGIYLGL